MSENASVSTSNSATVRFAFKTTIPVLVGYLGLGMAFGIMLEEQGFGPLWAGLFSLITYGGTIQYLAISMLTAVFNPFEAFILSFLVGFRHIFYGISFAEKYRGMGWRKLFLIYGLSDETFSLISSTDVPEDVDPKNFYLFVTLMDHSYWILGSILGGVVGSLITFNTTGLSFILTALFVVLFMEQIKKPENRASGLLGIVASAFCVLLFKDDMMIPAMILIVAIILLWRRISVHRV